jgi:hypothetical protein
LRYLCTPGALPAGQVQVFSMILIPTVFAIRRYLRPDLLVLLRESIVDSA